MKKILILLFILIKVNLNAQTQSEKCNCITRNGKAPISAIDKYFVGGEEAYRKLIKDSLSIKHNYIFKDNDYVGLLINIDKKGYLTNIKVLEPISTCLQCDEEAVRLVSTIKKWVPACDATKKKCKHIPVSIVVFVPFGKSSWIFMD
jgi:hypothetical protein